MVELCRPCCRPVAAAVYWVAIVEAMVGAWAIPTKVSADEIGIATLLGWQSGDFAHTADLEVITPTGYWVSGFAGSQLHHRHRQEAGTFNLRYYHEYEFENRVHGDSTLASATVRF
jgi:hypothetical protein